MKVLLTVLFLSLGLIGCKDDELDVYFISYNVSSSTESANGNFYRIGPLIPYDSIQSKVVLIFACDNRYIEAEDVTVTGVYKLKNQDEYDMFWANDHGFNPIKDDCVVEKPSNVSRYKIKYTMQFPIGVYDHISNAEAFPSWVDTFTLVSKPVIKTQK